MWTLVLRYLQHWMDFSNTLNASLTAGWVTLAVLLLRFVLKKSPKWVHVALWSFVAVRLLLPFSLESSVSVLPAADVFPAMQSYEQMQAPAELELVNNPMYWSVTVGLGYSVDRLSIRLLKMTAVWLVGAAVMLLYTAGSYLWLRYRVRTAVRLRNNLYQSEYVQSPFVLGLLRPRIYLPMVLREEELNHVIAHEDAHIRRKDHWWKLLGFLLLSFHWFNPLLWLAYVLLCRDIEAACDEKVVKGMSAAQRADYAQTLLRCSAQRSMPAACPLAFGETGVKERIQSVLNYKKPVFWVSLVCILLCMAAAVVLLTNPLSSPAPAKAVGPYDTTGLGGDFLKSDNDAYAVGANAYGMPVFWDHSAAYSAFTKEYAAGIAAIQEAWQLKPLTRRTYEMYKTYGWQTPCGDEELDRQCHQVTLFFDLYENSFEKVPRNTVQPTLPAQMDTDLTEEMAWLPQVLKTFPAAQTKETQSWPVSMAAPFIPSGAVCTDVSAVGQVVYIDYQLDGYRYLTAYKQDGTVEVIVSEWGVWSPGGVPLWIVNSTNPGKVKYTNGTVEYQVQRYTGGEFLGMNMGLSYMPEDGSYYASIELCGDRLTVTSSEGELLYGGDKPEQTRYTHGTLLSMLAEDWTGVPEDEIPAYTNASEMSVYSWYRVGEEQPAYSIWCFHGRPTWFAEGESLRIYKLIPLG